MSGEMSDMTRQRNTERELERLNYVLDVYGGDSNRWPEQDRLGLKDLLTHDAAARRLVREARMLDLLIENSELEAPVQQSGDLALLSNRIMAQARAEKQPAQRTYPRHARVTAIAQRPSRSHLWQAATLMAACLVTGIMVGSSGLVLSPTEQVTEISSFDETITGLLADEELTIFVGEDII